jgi:NAD(P)-dependent dehydrogenase (short-subunit alcohol dehydrogenase family)
MATRWSHALGETHLTAVPCSWRATLTNVVAPGFTVTEDNLARFPDEVREQVRERTPSGRLSVPEDVAAAVVFLSSPANTNITGSSTVAALHAGRLRAAPTGQVTISGWEY